MHFFLTFTVNQLEHFGVKNIKRWIDSEEWCKHVIGFSEFSKVERDKYKKGLQQAAAPILLRNWMETSRKILIDYIYYSPKSPYAPVNAIFARDEYQKEKETCHTFILFYQFVWTKSTWNKRTGWIIS